MYKQCPRPREALPDAAGLCSRSASTAVLSARSTSSSLPAAAAGMQRLIGYGKPVLWHIKLNLGRKYPHAITVLASDHLSTHPVEWPWCHRIKQHLHFL